jgi:hypothetical protein
MSTTERPVANQTSQRQVDVGAGVGQSVPPVGEEIHLPGPTVLPLTTGIGITLIVIGTTIGYVWIAIGLIVFFVSAGLWIRDTIRDVDALPEEHHH